MDPNLDPRFEADEHFDDDPNGSVIRWNTAPPECTRKSFSCTGRSRDVQQRPTLRAHFSHEKWKTPRGKGQLPSFTHNRQSGWIATPNPKTMVISQTTRKTDSIICVCDKKATFIGTTFCRCGAKLTWDAVVAMIDNAKAIQHVSARKRTETLYGVAKGSSRRTGRGTARTHANILNTLLLLGSLVKKHSW